MRRAYVLLLAALLAAPASASSSDGVQVTRLDRPDGPSFLLVPRPCLRELVCPLVVVSHPRGQSAERLRTSPQVANYTTTFTKANFAVLLSNDGGPSSWGNPEALNALGELHASSVERFRYNGRTYAFGLSMGGLMALRSAQSGPYPVAGVILLDARVDLLGAWAAPGGRRTEIETAYGTYGPPSVELDPLLAAEAGPRLPMYVIGSHTDTVVPFNNNGLRLYQRAAQPDASGLSIVPGAHLGAAHFSPELARGVTSFIQTLERRMLAPPALPPAARKKGSTAP